ncbi:MAG: hypothetical protein ABGZ53_27365 [Fuerstiella sp.]
MVTGHTVQQARDILAKWSSHDLLDRISSLPEIPEIPPPHFSEVSATAEDPAEEVKVLPKLQSAQESESESGVDVILPAEQETGSQEISLERPENRRAEAEVTAESEVQTESERHTEPERASDTSTADPTDSNDSVAAAGSTAEKDASSMMRVLPVSTEHHAEQYVEESDVQAQSDAGLHSGVTPTSTATHEHNEQPKPKPPQRRSQQRAVQQREHQSRKPKAEVSSKGSNAVAKTFRIDTPGKNSGDTNADAAGGTIKSNSSTGGGRRRIDTAEPVGETVETGSSRSRTQGRPRRRYIDEPHDSAVRGPHFQVTVPRRSNITTITGQFLAYAGVLGLTIGTAMVIYGHFGGYSDYTPTGWLVTTVAQMMLFLGVINLVSGGIEQTNDDVSQRINVLGEQLMRIEQVTEEALRGPKIPAHRYADSSAAAESNREVVPVGERD